MVRDAGDSGLWGVRSEEGSLMLSDRVSQCQVEAEADACIAQEHHWCRMVSTITLRLTRNVRSLDGLLSS